MNDHSTPDVMSRRLALVGAGLAFVAPTVTGASGVAQAQAETPLAALWREVKNLDEALEPHAAAIEAASAKGGVPGWMRLQGEANRLGEERYRRLVAIINGPVSSDVDLAIKAQAALHDDIRRGAFTWAGEALAMGVMARLGNAVA